MSNQKELDSLNAIFLSLLEPYEEIIMQWIECGELEDPH